MPRIAGRLDPRKRDAILAAAGQMFRERGLGAPMETIALAAGVSKQTIYNHFGSKTELIEEMVRDRVDRIAAPLRSARAHDDPAATLRALAAIFLGLTIDPETSGLFRIMTAGAADYPELATLLHERGVNAVRGELARFIREEDEGGRLFARDSGLAAELFHALVVGGEQLRVLLALPSRLAPDDVPARAAECVRVFMAAYGPQPENRE